MEFEAQPLEPAAIPILVLLGLCLPLLPFCGRPWVTRAIDALGWLLFAYVIGGGLVIALLRWLELAGSAG